MIGRRRPLRLFMGWCAVALALFAIQVALNPYVYLPLALEIETTSLDRQQVRVQWNAGSGFSERATDTIVIAPSAQSPGVSGRVEVSTNGDKDPQSKGGEAWINSIRVLRGGAWSAIGPDDIRTDGSTVQRGSSIVLTTAGGTLSFEATSDAVEIAMGKHPFSGIVRVRSNGHLIREINLFSPGPGEERLVLNATPAPGAHRHRIQLPPQDLNEVRLIDAQETSLGVTSVKVLGSGGEVLTAFASSPDLPAVTVSLSGVAQKVVSKRRLLLLLLGSAAVTAAMAGAVTAFQGFRRPSVRPRLKETARELLGRPSSGCRPESMRRLAPVAAFALLPLLLSALNPDWFYTDPYLLPWFDPFVYLVLFIHPIEYITAHPDYYPATRLPWILLGYGFYGLLPPLAANFLLKHAIYAVTITATFTTARALADVRTAAIATLLMGFYPFFIMAMGWDNIDASVTLLLALGYACTVAAARSPGPLRKWDFALGVVASILISSHLFAAIFFPSALIFYAACQRRLNPNHRVSLLPRLLYGAGGVLVGLLGLSILSSLMGGFFFVLKTQIGSLAQASGEASLAVVGYVALWRATWNAVLTAVFVLALAAMVAAARQRSRPEPARSGEEVFVLLIMLHYVLLYGLFWIATFTVYSAMAIWFFAGFLQVSCFVTLAVLLRFFRRQDRDVPLWPWLAAALPLAAIHYPPVARTIQTAVSLEPNSGFVLGTGLALTGLGLAVAAVATGRRALPPLAGVGMAVTYTLFAVTAQLNYWANEPRRFGFSAILDAAEATRDFSNAKRRFIWIDRTEKPYGDSILHASWIASLLSSKEQYMRIGDGWNTKFPDVPYSDMRAGDRLIIMTARPDWKAAAASGLRPHGLELVNERVQAIKQGKIEFAVIGGNVTALGPSNVTRAP